MKSTPQHPPIPFTLTRRSLLRWGSALGGSSALGLLGACGGGGGDSATAASPVTAAAFTSGAITGFGSIIVNGVRFDDSAATVLDDRGGRLASSDLKLGAHVEIESGSIDRGNGRAQATTIRLSSELLGPVAAVDAVAGTLSVLDQAIEVQSSTVFDSALAGGLAAVAVGQVLEIHAQLDTARGVYVASRIEPRSGVSSYKLRGVVSGLDSAAKTLRLGAALIDYSGVAQLPASLADGSWLKVRLATTPVAGAWVAQSLDNGQRHRGEDHGEAELKGLITAWTSATAFSVDGLAVDAAAAAFPDGTAGVVLGARVEVQGQISNGVLLATRVHVEDETEHARGEDYELHGTVSALDTVAKTFVLRGITVDYASVSEWRKLAASDLGTAGLKVEVKGDLSDDGTRLQASRVSRDD